jgi:hypothetical protein
MVILSVQLSRPAGTHPLVAFVIRSGTQRIGTFREEALRRNGRGRRCSGISVRRAIGVAERRHEAAGS